MTLEGVDFSWGRPGGAALVAAGKHFVIRYVPYAGDGGKGLEAAEIADYRSHGLGICLVFESTMARALTGGYAGGVADAKTSVAAIAALGMPSSMPVYFAVDTDTTATNWPAIDAYFDGAISVMGKARVGVYGEASLMDHLRDKVDYLWQTYAWSGGVMASGIDLLQYLNGQTINGAGVDYVRAYVGDYGQWEGDVHYISSAGIKVNSAYLIDLAAGTPITGFDNVQITKTSSKQTFAFVGRVDGSSSKVCLRLQTGAYPAGDILAQATTTAQPYLAPVPVPDCTAQVLAAKQAQWDLDAGSITATATLSNPRPA